MDKIENPYHIILQRLYVLDKSIHILKQVNNDLREILHKQKPLPKFIHDSFKRSIISKSKTSSALPPPLPPPTETEEMRLAASIIDKAKRAIENVGEKKPKQQLSVITPVSTSAPSTNSQTNRPKAASSVRPSSARSTMTPPSDSTPPQSQPQPQPVRRYIPAHMKAPFQTQPEKKRRPSSAIRNNSQTTSNSNQRTSATRRSVSQQRRLSSSSTSTQPIIELSQQNTLTPSIPLIQNENSPIVDHQNMNDINHEAIVPDHTTAIITTEEHTNISNEIDDINIPAVPQPIILNRTLVKPLRRLWKQNQNLRLQLEHELNKKVRSSPTFINRLNEQIYSTATIDEIRLPNIEILLQLAIKLRAIILYLLENGTFDDLDGAFKRLNTLKYLVNRYHSFFTSNLKVLVTNHRHHRPSNMNFNIEELINQSKSSRINQNIVRYTDDGQLIAFTEVRFKQFENECRWIELNWHEQMILQFKQTLSNQNQNPLQIYRELMSLVTGLQTSTPIVVENRLE